MIFRETGRSMHYFQGSREHSSPLGGLESIHVKMPHCLYSHTAALIINAYGYNNY